MIKLPKVPPPYEPGRGFILAKAEEAIAEKFIAEHSKVCPNNGKYQGTIGIGYTYTFSDTSIGEMASVKCHCGASQFLSLYL